MILQKYPYVPRQTEEMLQKSDIAYLWRRRQSSMDDNNQGSDIIQNKEIGIYGNVQVVCDVNNLAELDVRQVAKRILRNEEGVIGDLLSLTSFILNQ